MSENAGKPQDVSALTRGHDSGLKGRVRHYIRRVQEESPSSILRRVAFKVSHAAKTRAVHLRWERAVPRVPAGVLASVASDWANTAGEGAAAFVGELPDWASWDAQTRCGVLQLADATCAGVFDLLGSGPLPLGLPPDWHKDFKTGFAWPHEEAYHRVLGFTPAGSDVKAPWELSRANWLMPLACAWRLTGEARYAEAAAALLLDWIERNPPGRGVNWLCAMDVGMRAANWIWGVVCLQGAPGFDSATMSRIAASLWVHGCYIRENLERSPFHTGNHYLADMVGLFHLGLFFRGCGRGRRWMRLAWAEIQREMARQVYEDGGYYEASVPYHRLGLEFFAVSAILAKRNGLVTSPGFTKSLGAMFRFTQGCVGACAEAPQVGDNDSGRLFTASSRPIGDHGYLLSWGALILGDASLKHAGAPLDAEARLLLGREGEQAWAALAAEGRFEGRLSGDFGLATLCDPATGDGLAFFAGPIGQEGLGGHAHNDKLSFVLTAGGRPFVVDPGTGCYTPEPEWRNRFRSTESHSTLGIEGQEQARFKANALFRMDQDPAARITAFREDEAGGVVAGIHEGWMRLNPPLRHEREITWERSERRWSVRDALTGGASAPAPRPEGVYVSLVLHPDVAVEPMGSHGMDLVSGEVRVAVRLAEGSRYTIAEGWYSAEYGRWCETKKVVISPGESMAFEIQVVGDGAN